jgi:hypothetical protein
MRGTGGISGAMALYHVGQGSSQSIEWGLLGEANRASPSKRKWCYCITSCRALGVGRGWLRGGGVQARPQHYIASDKGAYGAVLRAFDQALPDTTDRRTERRGVIWWVPPGGGESVVKSAGVPQGTRCCMKRKEKENSNRGIESPYIHNFFFLPRV